MKLMAALTLSVLSVNSFAHSVTYLKSPKNIPGAKKMNFGLSDAQKLKIRTLTQGKVDLTGMYIAKDVPSNLDPKVKVLGIQAASYPPPVVESEYDPSQQQSWWQEALKVSEAWTLATGAGVTIADCDAGYHHTEGDIAPNLLMEHAYDLADVQNPTKIDDGNFVSHGTSVVAIMSGVLDGAGVNGIAYNSKVVPLQNYNYNSGLDDIPKEEATAACILHALKLPEVKIIVLENQTWGSSETFAGTRDAVTLALNAGVTIVSAAGNSSNELTEEEAHDTGSIIVGALARNGKMATFSNFGKRVSIAAYGEGLLTLAGPNGRLSNFGGTSGATPQVAATVALMLEVNPNLTPAQVKEILIATRQQTADNAKVGGLVDVVQAVTQARDAQPETPMDVVQAAFRSELSSILNEGE